MLCPKCAFPNLEPAAFCSRCGTALKPSSLIAEPEARASSQAERRRLTVMFCDLVGSTELSGQLDPEELHDLTRQYQKVCADVVGRHGGHVAQYLGDGLLVFFGYPIAHEDDAQRAVRAGLETVAAVSGLSVRLAKSLQIRVAVHTGLAVVGRLGDGSDPEAMGIVGETPNIAARLQAIAEPGTVIISAPTHQLVEGFFRCRSLGALPLKGVAIPIELYCVLGESGIQSRFDRAVATGLTPFVGREAEIALLLERWERARAGSGQVVLLCGEAGIGKSRLIRVLSERITGEHATELAARCSPYYQDSALYPVINLLERYLQFQRDDSTDMKLAILERALERFGFYLPEAVPMFAVLLSLPFEHRYPPLRMTPERQKQRTFDAIVAWLLKSAQQHPIRMVVEDIHWADPSTIEFLGLLIDQVSQAPLFVTLVFRSEFVPPWRWQPHVTSITLGRLSRAATESVIESIAGDKKLPTEVAREIVEKTEGVPLFVEELTRMVLESGLLREQDDHYELTRVLTSLAIPSTLYESLMARLDRLGTAKEVAQLSATIGKEFSYDLIRAISPLDEAKLTGALNRLVDAELLDQHLLSFQPSYSFRHALIRDAAYQSLLNLKRREYHRRIAVALQESFHEIVNANPELIAAHYTDAGLVDQAIPYWQRAGQRALERSANQEAIRHLRKALELLRTLPENPERLQQELSLEISLGTALMATKGFPTDQVIGVYARARELSERLGEATQLFRVLWGQWLNCTSRREHRAALELGQQCLRVAERARDPMLLAQAHQTLGAGYCTTGEFTEALGHLEQAITVDDPVRQRSHADTYGHDPGVLSLILSGFSLWFLGYPDQALKRNDEGLALAEKLSHPATSALAAAFAAMVQQFCRNAQAVEELAGLAVDLSTRYDLAFQRAMGTILGAWAMTQRGQKATGIARMRRALEGLRASGAVLLMGYFSLLLAGEVEQPEEGLSILAGVDSSSEYHWAAELYRLKGELLLRQGERHLINQAEAEQCFCQALTISREKRAKSLELRAAMSVCRLRLREGKRLDARQALEGIFGSFSEGFDTPDLRDAKMLLEELAG